MVLFFNLFQAVEKGKQKQTPDTQNNRKGSQSSSSSGCEKVNGVHQNGADVVLQNRQPSEQGQQCKNHVRNGKEEKKPAQQRKTEQQQQQQPEVSNEGGVSRKKQSHADQEVAMSRQNSRKTCCGKENNVVTRRKAEDRSKKKRQEPVAPEPATVEKNDVDKSKCGGRKQEQKKQGKKKASLGKAHMRFGNVGTNTSHSAIASSLTSLDVSRTYSVGSPGPNCLSANAFGQFFPKRLCAIDQYHLSCALRMKHQHKLFLAEQPTISVKHLAC